MGAALLNLAPSASQLTQQNAPVITPAPNTPYADSPIHVHVSDILAKNPNATAEDVAGNLGNGITPAIAAKVMSDVRGIPTRPATPPTAATPPMQLFSNQVPDLVRQMAPAMQPQSQGGPPRIDPRAYGNTQSAALANRNAGIVDAADRGVTPPISAANAPAMQPNYGMMGNVSPTAIPAPATPSAQPPAPAVSPQVPAIKPAVTPGINNPVAADMRYPDANASNPATPIAPAVAPGAIPKHSNNFMEGLGKFLPSAAVALLSSKNPAMGASILQGYQRGEAQNKAEKQQQAAIDAQGKQQVFENQIKQGQLEEAKAYHEGELKNTAEKTDVTKQHYDDMKSRYGDQAMAQFDKDIAQFSGNPAAQLQIAARYDKTHGTTAFSESLGNGTGDSDKAAYDKVRGDIAQQRANDNTNLVAANIGKIDEQAGLIKSQKGYTDAKTGEVVPEAQAHIRQANATADFLTTRTGEVVPLAEADIAYKGALGAAAGENAATNRYKAQTDAAKATADIQKIATDIGVNQARMQQIAAKDPAFAYWAQQLKGAEDRKQKAQLDSTLSDLDKKRIADSEDVNIENYTKLINSRIKSNGETPATVPNMPNQPPTIPNVSSPQGKQTPRSQAWKSGGSVPVVPTPLGDKVNAAAVAMQKSGQANQPHYCERVARQTYQQATHDYDKYWDSTAKQTAQNFKSAGLAQPYKPGMAVPAGSLLYSTNGKSGHVQIVGNDGTRYDQYGKNKFAPSYFQYFVPPPGSKQASTNTARPDYHSMSTRDLLSHLASKFK